MSDCGGAAGLLLGLNVATIFGFIGNSSPVRNPEFFLILISDYFYDWIGNIIKVIMFRSCSGLYTRTKGRFIIDG